jgi:putative sterol carrier protein
MCRIMVITSPKEFFQDLLPRKFDPAKAAGVDAVIQMNITGPNWTIEVRDQRIDIKEGIHPSPAITVKVADTDFVDLVNGKLNAVGAFMAGKIEFKGSISLGLKLVDLGII